MKTVGGWRRPSGRLRINYAGPTAHALHSVWVPQRGENGAPTRMVDLVANREAQAYGSTLPYLEDTQTGVGIRTPLAAGYRADGARWAPQSAGGFAPATLMWVGRIRSFDTGGNLYGIGGAGGGNPNIALCQGNPGQFSLQVWLSSYTNVNPAHVIGVDELLVAIGTTRSATDHEIVLWSQVGGTGSPGSTPITCTAYSSNAGSASSDALYELFGTASTATPTSFDSNATHELCASWLRSMTRQEMVALAQNPWQVVRPEPSRFSAVSGGVGSSIFVPRPKLITSGFWAA